MRIKLHIRKSQLGEHQRDAIPLSAQVVHLTRSHFHASDLPVMADAQVTLNPEPAEVFLAPFHLPQPLGSDMQTIENPAGEAGSRRRIPDRNIQLLGRMAHLLFGPTEIQQRRPNLMLRTGTHPGTMLSYIVGVGSVDDGIEAPFPLHSRQLSPKLRLAVVATISGIAQVSRILKLIGFELQNRYIETCSQPQSGIGLNGRIGSTAPDDRKKALGAENLAAYHCKQARIHASGISQDNAAQRGKMAAQLFEVGHAQKRNGEKRDRRDK